MSVGWLAGEIGLNWLAFLSECLADYRVLYGSGNSKIARENRVSFNQNEIKYCCNGGREQYVQ